MQEFVLVMTCSPTRPVLSNDLLTSSHVLPLLPERSVKWLSENISCETFTFSKHSDALACLADVRTALEGTPVDVNIVPFGTSRRKRLLIADMDSTIIQQECIDELAEAAGVGDYVRGVTERAMRGELAFAEALRERVGLLKGLNRADLRRVLDERIVLMPGAATLVQTMRAHGAYCALVSGGFTWFTQVIAERVGFHESRANRLEFDGACLSGRVIEPILGQEAKLEALRRMLGERQLDAAASVAVGDGANDLAMIGHAGLGVAYRAKPIVADQADASVVHSDLTALLYLQGYTQAEFRSGSP